MSPAEKAKELTDKYRLLVTYWDCYHDTALPDETVLKDCKKCALIAANEISLTLLQLIGNQQHMWTVSEKEQMLFWYQVKEEIEKL